MTDAKEPKNPGLPRSHEPAAAQMPFEQRLGTAIRELTALVSARDAQVKADALLARLLSERPWQVPSRQRRRALVLAAITAARQSPGLGRAIRRRRSSRLHVRRWDRVLVQRGLAALARAEQLTDRLGLREPVAGQQACGFGFRAAYYCSRYCHARYYR
jgi:hypothetical protein